MNLNVCGHSLEITPAIRGYLTERLGRICCHFDHMIDVDAIFSAQKLTRKVEAKVHVSGKDLICECADADTYAAIDGLANKLDRRILRHRERLADHHNQESTRRPAA